MSGNLPTHPSPKQTLSLTSHLGQNVGLGEGYPETQIDSITLAPARKQYRIGFLFTHKNGDFGAISVSGAAKQHLSDL